MTWVVHMASLRRLHRSDAKDGRFDGVRCDAAQVGPNYPYFVIVFFLAHKGILVFWFTINRIIGLLWEVSLSLPLRFRSSFY
jgi:hypothetical protein